MPSSLPPLPTEITDQKPSGGSAPPPTGSAFSGGMPPTIAALKQIEDGLKTLATSVPSLLPMCAQMISQLRTAVPQAIGADASSGPSGGPTGPAITGMGQNPTALPSPPQGAM
jgi:hypothetical protein